jgi:hypothetical protein
MISPQEKEVGHVPLDDPIGACVRAKGIDFP